MYVERPSVIAGATAWWGVADGAPTRVLPDGCIDLLWLGDHLVVAGPDTVAHMSQRRCGSRVAGLRFASGVAPSVLGVPAHALRDERVGLDVIWDRAEVEALEDVVAAADVAVDALESITRAHGRGPAVADALVRDVVRRARAGERVATIADAVGLSVRQLQRRSRVAFGYGPKLLARILRLGDALEVARCGLPLADVAAHCGYADQAHLADDVRELTGTTLGALGLARRGRAQPAGSAANRSMLLPSGSSTDA